MFRLFDQRSHKLERLDTGDYTPEEYSKWQSEMRMINRLLGDARALRLSLRPELHSSACAHLSSLDVGAGSGELLKTAKESFDNRLTFLVGAERNENASKTINARFDEFSVRAVRCDALRLPFADDSFDFVISSLFLHHLTDRQAVILIVEMSRVARRRFFVIDLHRHPTAYHLYNKLGRFVLQKFTLEDGSLSILRGFRPSELLDLAAAAGINDAVVKRRAAFRLVLSGGKRIKG